MPTLHARATVIKSNPDERFVFAPIYPPGVEWIDAHGEFTDARELQHSLHDFMRGSREIRLQHSPHVIGEAVEGFSSPWALPVELTLPTGETNTVTLPAGTTYMGAIIRPQFWPLYKRGLLRGWSMGGVAHRIEVDLEPQLELAKAFFDADPLPDDLQVVETLGKSCYQIYSPSLARVWRSFSERDEAVDWMTKHGSHDQSSHGSRPTPPKTSPDADNIVRSIAAKRGMGASKSGDSFTLVSPSSRYSSDVESTASDLQAAGYSPVKSTNNWSNGAYGISAHFADKEGNGIFLNHHTPESYHYTEGRKTIQVPDRARKLRIGVMGGSVQGALGGGTMGGGMAPLNPGASAAPASATGEGVYGGQNSLIAGAPPM